MTETFADAARTTPLDERTWTSPLHEAYNLWRGTFIHGGFGMAVAVDAMAQAAGRPDPVTITAHFLEQVKLEEARIEVDVLRSGGRHSTVAAELVQGGVTKIRLTGTFGDTAAADGPSFHRPPPVCPEWDDCAETGFPGGFTTHVDARIDASTAGFMQGTPSGSNASAGRLRFRSDEPVAGPALAFLSDVMFSPAIEMGVAQLGWIPTVELTMHVHDASYVGEVLTVIRTDHLSEGYATEDVEIWSGDGTRFLAAARQLALVRKPA